jgi:hypothetical protein
MVCDKYNYDAESDQWCPLAVGLGVPEIVAASPMRLKFTNESAKVFITAVGRGSCPTFTLNPISGVPGNYFRDNRVDDIVTLCRQIIAERAETTQTHGS